MTAPETPPPAKSPPPSLDARAPRPVAVRLRRPVVRAVVFGGALLVAGSMTWAFVVWPELREARRVGQADTRDDPAAGRVRPAETVTELPATYDRLPPPRIGAEPDAPPAATAAPSPPRPLRRAATGPGEGDGANVRDLAVRSDLFFERRPEATDGSPSASAAERPAAPEGVYADSVLTPPRSPFELKAGAILPAALLTAVDTARAGPVVAAVTQPVYDSVTGRHLLVPQGSRLIGMTDGGSVHGDRRAFLAWRRLILPNGKSLVLGGEAAVDAQGAVGVRGRVDRRLLPMLAGTLLAGAVTTLGQLARDDDDGGGGFIGDAGDAAAIEGARVGGRLIDRELDVRPSIRVVAGAPVRVLITRDLILEPYAP